MSTQRNPKAPAEFTDNIKKLWAFCWNIETTTSADYYTIDMLCRLKQERDRLDEGFITGTVDDFLWINNNTNLVMHPAKKRIEAIDKEIKGYFIELGMSAKARAAILKDVQQSEDNDIVNIFNTYVKEQANERATKK